jgi:hypothetical protein
MSKGWSVAPPPVPPFVIPWVAGRFYAVGPPMARNVTTFTPGNNTIQFLPTYVPNDVTISEVSAEVTGSGGTGTFRFGIYKADDLGKPDMLLVDFGSVTTGGTTGVKSIAVSQYLPKGFYWFALALDGANQTTRGISSGNGYLGFASTTSAAGKSSLLIPTKNNIATVAFPKRARMLGEAVVSPVLNDDYSRFLVGV